MENFKKKVLGFLDHFLIGKYEKYSLSIVAFIDSVLAFLPLEILVFYYFLRHKNARIIFQSIMITVASVLGFLILYFLSSSLINLFPSILNSSAYLEVSKLLNYSIWIQFLTVLFFAFSSSIPFTWLAVLLGIMNLNLIIVIPGIFIGRFLRFFILAFLTKHFGERTFKILKKYLKELVFLIVIGIVVFVVWKYFI